MRHRCSKACSSSAVSWWHSSTKLGREMATGSLRGLGRRHEVGVVGEGRVAADPEVVLHPALGGQAVVVPAHRVEDGSRPACAGSGPRRRCGCRRRRGRCGASPTRSAAGCRWRTPRSRGAVRSKGRCRPSSQRADQVASRPSRPGLSGIPRARPPGRSIRSRAALMIGLPYPACSGSTTPPPARWRRSRLRDPGRVVHVRLRADGLRRCPTSATAGSPWSSTCSAATCCSPGLEVTYVSNITDIEDKIIDRAADRGHRPSREVTADIRGRVVGGHGRPRRAPARRDPPRHRLRGPDGRADRRAGRTGAWPTRPATASTCRSTDVPGYGLLAHQPLDSLRAGARVEADEEKRSPARLRPVEEGQAGRADLGVAVGAGPAGLAHRVRGDVPRPAGRRASTSTAAAMDLIFPHHENERAQAVAVGPRVRPALDAQRVGDGGRREDVQVAGQLHLARPTCWPRSDARAYRLLVLRSHYRSPIEVTPETIADAEAGLARLDELARRFALGRPAGRRPGGRPARRSAVRPARLDGEAVDAGSGTAWTTTSTPRRAGRRVRPGPPGQRRRRRRRRRPGPHAAAARWPCCAAPSGLRAPERGDEPTIDPATADLVRRRDEARAARRLGRADALRDQLEAAGLAGRGRSGRDADPPSMNAV